MLKNPSVKYKPSETIQLMDRTWVNQKITRPPVWLSTDLRDGNQSLFEPMSVQTKMIFFKELVRIGLKEIEVGFPSASEIDFKFVRTLIEEGHIPHDVTPMVMTQAREDLIAKSVDSLRGAKRAIVHIYNATAPAWRDIVFGMNVDEVMMLIQKQVSFLKKITDEISETEWLFQYSPETFSATELPVALEACNVAINSWNANPQRKIIINLPSTVENTTPNVFADRIEWMGRHIERRDSVILSVHPHNDRGTGVATAELALLAGAERVEGCLFGNGERCGNVDLVTLALNLYTQGVNPNLDFSNINRIAKIVEESTQLPIHPRHPYVGDLVFTAFSGSHQDAIKKGFAHQKESDEWLVPYLPIDPQDLGRSYESVIRVNSQSGKGGIAYLLERDFGIVMPRRLQIEFSNEVKKVTDETEAEMTSHELFQLFEKTYLNQSDLRNFVGYCSHKITDQDGIQMIEICTTSNGQKSYISGKGNGPIEAAMNALNLPIEILNYEERSIGSGAKAKAVTIIEMSNDKGFTKFGAGIDGNIVSASIKAIFSAVNRLNLTTP
jgi:2-isopropylmalate synthase